jgi:hypothetical protein
MFLSGRSRTFDAAFSMPLSQFFTQRQNLSLCILQPNKFANAMKSHLSRRYQAYTSMPLSQFFTQRQNLSLCILQPNKFANAMKSHLSRRYQAYTTISCVVVFKQKVSKELTVRFPLSSVQANTSRGAYLRHHIVVNVLERLIKVCLTRAIR